MKDPSRLVTWVERAVGAERRRLDVENRPPLPVAAAILVGAAMVAWGNGLVLISRRAHPPDGESVTLIGQIVVVGLTLAVLLRGRRFSRAELGWRRPRMGGVAGGVLGAAATAAAGISLAVLIRDPLGHIGATAVTLARLLVATAMGEELLFRGVLFAVWNRTTATDRAIVMWTTVAFVLWHVAGAFDEGRFSPVALLGPAVGGPLFLWARCRFSSVLAPAALHAAANLPVWAVLNR